MSDNSRNSSPISNAIYRELRHRVRMHYGIRGFESVLVEMLCKEMDRRCSDLGICVAKDRWEPVDQLIDVFEPVEQRPMPAIQHLEPIAIFALSFGYRLDSPFARRPGERQPGPNNLAIARQLRHCHHIFPNAWVAVQNEIALALQPASSSDELDPIAPDWISPARDWTTVEVLSHFIDRLRKTMPSGNRNVLVVSHVHHYGRCAFLLSRDGFEPAFPPLEAVPYTQYDEQEAQPRFRSAWDYLLNDFVALCRTSQDTRDLATPFGRLCA